MLQPGASAQLLSWEMAWLMLLQHAGMLLLGPKGSEHASVLAESRSSLKCAPVS
jgi:hypothetical protein